MDSKHEATHSNWKRSGIIKGTVGNSRDHLFQVTSSATAWQLKNATE